MVSKTRFVSSPRPADPVSFINNLISPLEFMLPGSTSVVFAQNETVTSIGFTPSPSNGYVVLISLTFHSPPEPVYNEVTCRALDPSPV